MLITSITTGVSACNIGQSVSILHINGALRPRFGSRIPIPRWPFFVYAVFVCLKYIPVLANFAFSFALASSPDLVLFDFVSYIFDVSTRSFVDDCSLLYVHLDYICKTRIEEKEKRRILCTVIII